MPKTRFSVLLLSLFVLISFDTACGQPPVNSVQDLTPPPPVRREFRGAWIASVENIDWPSEPGLSTRQQQQELLEMLDRAVQLRLNAVILQVRPAADALYASPYEPWSEYLTGKMGRAPSPYYDPLEFAVNEAHRRGLELHAWFNPYRARHPSARSAPSRDHISVTHPEYVKRYGSNLWMDPGEPAVRQQTIRVVLDVVKRYDIDGVHIDDYFYPYKEKDRRGNNIDFPDATSWRRYKASGGSLSKDDWRRANVDSLIHQVYLGIKASKPWVKFGISPFGVWRPGYPSITAGKFDSYAELYGDSRKWVLNGWADYFTPQLYWPIDRPDLSYPILLQWWVEQNARGRHIWPGNYVDKVTGTPSGWLAEEMLNQIALTRAQPGATGNVYFSMRTLMGNGDNLPQKLMSGPYASRALVPASPWLDSIPPLSPIVRVGTDAVTLANTISLQPQGTEPTWLWLVRTRVGGDWTTEVVPGLQRFYTLPRLAGGAYADAVSVSAVDRCGNESAPVITALTPAVSR
ncbi:MAG TPA: family 10 glycosylhydrolase [Gemmatimonadaceae bacterium]|nr:family 10 glycosylhydrolase [Gemmatimonadaceae bacterium]